ILPFLLPGLIGGGVLAILLFKNKPCDPSHVKKFFEGFHIGGHRGAPKSFPENGMAGFAQVLLVFF
ncbi:hypothetical protein OESDEN_23350, partial [Oesophagostomum dentatum]